MARKRRAHVAHERDKKKSSFEHTSVVIAEHEKNIDRKDETKMRRARFKVAANSALVNYLRLSVITFD